MGSSKEANFDERQRKERKDKFSRLDIVDDHELKVRQTWSGLTGRCSCGEFEHHTSTRSPIDYEHLNDVWLKHVQKIRDQMRGHTHG